MTVYLTLALALSSAVLGLLLWRESRRRADAETKYLSMAARLDATEALAAGLKAIKEGKERKIRELESKLPAADVFDSVFRGYPDTSD